MHEYMHYKLIYQAQNYIYKADLTTNITNWIISLNAVNCINKLCFLEVYIKRRDALNK